MKFTLTIESDDAAMVDDTPSEVARMLDRAARDVRDGYVSGNLLDSNGNSAGTWKLSR